MSNTMTLPMRKPKERTGTKRQSPYNVVLLNDDDHTVEYVVAMMQRIFGHPVEKGLKVAEEVHFRGRCIVWTGSLEVAEWKQEQIHAFGADRQIPGCKGSMTAVVEPAA